MLSEQSDSTVLVMLLVPPTSISYIDFFVSKVGREVLLESLITGDCMPSQTCGVLVEQLFCTELVLDDENDWMVQPSFDDGLLN